MHLLPQYIHIINPKLKHIYLTFDEEGNLIIKSPKISHRRVEQLLLKKASWIQKSREKFQRRKGRALDFNKEPELYFLGKNYKLHLVAHEKANTKLTFDGTVFSLYYSTYDEITFQKHIDTFYKKEAKAYLPSLVEEWAKKMHLTYNKISFRKTKRQWGSCSGKNNLSFNTMVMKLPSDVIQYIIIHELAHITHKHHQKAFWKLVEVYLPSYKQQIQKLKNYTT
ncbi:MAG TPA: M48 family peptidase [Epsilonproteobacteria bacterium]|nr:M48 family peptidase [Campylobacterota bacterium]